MLADSRSHITDSRSHITESHIDPDDSAPLVLVLKWLLEFLNIFEDPGVRCVVRHHTPVRHAMLEYVSLE